MENNFFVRQLLIGISLICSTQMMFYSKSKIIRFIGLLLYLIIFIIILFFWYYCGILRYYNFLSCLCDYRCSGFSSGTGVIFSGGFGVGVSGGFGVGFSGGFGVGVSGDVVVSVGVGFSGVGFSGVGFSGDVVVSGSVVVSLLLLLLLLLTPAFVITCRSACGCRRYICVSVLYCLNFISNINSNIININIRASLNYKASRHRISCLDFSIVV